MILIQKKVLIMFYEILKINPLQKYMLRCPGIEPESREWESRMITITPTAHSFLEINLVRRARSDHIFCDLRSLTILLP